MKKTITTLRVVAVCVLAILLAYTQANAQQITIGIGTFNGIGDYGPIRATTAAGQTNRHAYIYNAALLGGLSAGNTLSSLGFRVMPNTLFTGPCSFKLYLADTSALTWGIGALDWSLATAGATLVYDQDITSIMQSANTWKYFDINDWNYNTGNLVLLCEYSQTNGQAVESPFFYDNSGGMPLYIKAA